jgi:hypothetical protein
MSSRTESPRVLTPRPWLRACVIVAATLFALGAVSTYLRSGWTWAAIAFALLALFGLAGVLETALTRIVLADTTLESRSLFSRRAFHAADIEAVTWEAGAGLWA